jgi:hypothetical protein
MKLQSPGTDSEGGSSCWFDLLGPQGIHQPSLDFITEVLTKVCLKAKVFTYFAVVVLLDHSSK